MSVGIRNMAADTARTSALDMAIRNGKLDLCFLRLHVEESDWVLADDECVVDFMVTLR